MAELPNADNIEDLSPYALLKNFSRSRVLPALFLALLVHVAAVGGLSTRYIYHTWINPSAALAETESPEETDETSDEQPAEEGQPADKTGSETGTKEAAEVVKKPKAGTDEELPPVVKRVTGAAEPKEIPDEPTGLGISIDDINN
jgi:hypothetical protein